MPWGLQRFHHTKQTHFVTFCCYHRYRLLTTDASRHVFETALERVRRSYRLYVYGYVVMAEHVHLLLSEPQEGICPQEKGIPQESGGPLKPDFGLSGDVNWLNKSEHYTLADALKSLKQGVSRRLIRDIPLKPKTGLSGPPEHFWQKRYYDLNIRNYAQFVEKLRYIHRNPVREQDFANALKIGNGAAFATMQLEQRDGSRSNLNGRRENVKGKRRGFVPQ
jgi:putative transposase